MFKDLFQKETFVFFIDRFASEDLVVRSRARAGSGRLFLFDLSGFVLFYVFLVVAKTVYRGGKLDPSDLIAPALLYVFLLYVGGVLFFALHLYGVGKDTILNLYDKIVFILLVALAIFAADHFLSNFVFRTVEAATCKVLMRACYGWPGVQKLLISMFYVTVGVAILAINTVKRHRRALSERSQLLRPVIQNCIATTVVAEVFGILVLKTLVLTIS
jgi:hypothetical protein